LTDLKFSAKHSTNNFNLVYIQISREFIKLVTWVKIAMTYRDFVNSRQSKHDQRNSNPVVNENR